MGTGTFFENAPVPSTEGDQFSVTDRLSSIRYAEAASASDLRTAITQISTPTAALATRSAIV